MPQGNADSRRPHGNEVIRSPLALTDETFEWRREARSEAVIEKPAAYNHLAEKAVNQRLTEALACAQNQASKA